MDAYCTALRVDPETFNKRPVKACVDTRNKLVILPADGTVDADDLADTIKHEDVHTWGPVHTGGHRPFTSRDGKPLKPLSGAQAQMLRAMADAEVREEAQRAPRGMMGASARRALSQ